MNSKTELQVDIQDPDDLTEDKFARVQTGVQMLVEHMVKVEGLPLPGILAAVHAEILGAIASVYGGTWPLIAHVARPNGWRDFPASMTSQPAGDDGAAGEGVTLGAQRRGSGKLAALIGADWWNRTTPGGFASRGGPLWGFRLYSVGPGAPSPNRRAPGPFLLIPLRATFGRSLDIDPFGHLDATRLEPVANLPPYLGRAVIALTEDAVDAAAETGGDGVRPWHDLQPSERWPGRKADRCSGWAVERRSGSPSGSFRGSNPTRVAKHDVSLGTEKNGGFVSF